MSQSWEKVLQAGKRTDDGQTDMTEFIGPSSRVKEFKNTCPSGNTFSGDEVFYKFDDSPEWRREIQYIKAHKIYAVLKCYLTKTIQN